MRLRGEKEGKKEREEGGREAICRAKWCDFWVPKHEKFSVGKATFAAIYRAII